MTLTPTDTVDYTNATTTVQINVNKATPTVGVTSSIGGVSGVGQSVTFTATVTGGSVTFDSGGGTVQFAVDGTPYSSPVSLSGGSATIADATLSKGTHTITATYSGDTNFSGSTSSPMTQTVGTPLESPPSRRRRQASRRRLIGACCSQLSLAVLRFRSCISMITPFETWVP